LESVPVSKTLGEEGSGEGNLQSCRNGRWRAAFDEFWKAYPRKVGKAAAMRKYEVVVKGGVAPAAILAGLARYSEKVRVERTETRFVVHPTTWLNQGRWEDEEAPGPAAGGRRYSFDSEEEARKHYGSSGKL